MNYSTKQQLFRIRFKLYLVILILIVMHAMASPPPETQPITPLHGRVSKEFEEAFVLGVRYGIACYVSEPNRDVAQVTWSAETHYWLLHLTAWHPTLSDDPAMLGNWKAFGQLQFLKTTKADFATH